MGWGAGLMLSNVLFGLLHCVTPLYGLLALFTGIYLGVMLDIGEERNLLTPMVVHGLYDFVAFWIVIQSYRAEQSQRNRR